MERVGETREYGWALLELLRADGWDVSEVVEDGKCKVRAEWTPEEVFFCVAPSFAEAAYDVFEACVRYKRSPRRAPVQPQLFLFAGDGIEH